jgi:ectoine hydroxylase-related dioxygenase (phytanoyl-CoA dioxygenase family)
MTSTVTNLPAPTEDLDRAERDLAEHGICSVAGVLHGQALREAHDTLYAIAELEARRGTITRFLGDNPDDHTNQRVYNLISKSPLFVDLAEHPIALRLLRTVLGWPMLLGNLSANITGPGGGEMKVHADQMFLPEPWPATAQGANAAWLIDDFTAENGATQFVPGSQLLNRNYRPGEDEIAPVPMQGPAGTLVVFNSRIWHRTGFNNTAESRRAGVFGWYTKPIYRSQENWYLSLDPAVLQEASEDMLQLLGYRATGLGLANGRSPR